MHARHNGVFAEGAVLGAHRVTALVTGQVGFGFFTHRLIFVSAGAPIRRAPVGNG